MFGLEKLFGKRSLITILPKVQGRYLENVALSKYTWFGVGGPAEVLFLPHDTKDLSKFLQEKPKNIPVCLIGGGSNLLVRDGGVPGVVIKLESRNFRDVSIDGTLITCQAGLKNAELKKYLLENRMGGLEFLCSIPGVIGGAIRSNAGCFGKELKDVLVGATIMNKEGGIKSIEAGDLSLSYRQSHFPDDWIILSVTLKTIPDSTENIQKIIEEQKAYRIANQPYNERTAGSTFKNPEGLRAWELIKKSGCAEMQVGGAKVSEKHCNFLVNTGTATAKDIETLGEQIIRQVKRHTTITLEWEIKRLGIEK